MDDWDSSAECARTDPAQITELLQRAQGGDAAAQEQLLPAIYADLRAIAHARLRGERADTLDTTGLVHEAWLAMAARPDTEFASRRHYFAYAAKAMRHVLVDRARRRLAGKRRADTALPTMDGPLEAVELLALDQALQRLGRLDERLLQVVELRLFAGFSSTEIGALLELTERTIERDWAKARALLSLSLQEQP